MVKLRIPLFLSRLRVSSQEPPLTLILHSCSIGLGGYLPQGPSPADPSSQTRYRVPRGTGPGSEMAESLGLMPSYTHPRLAPDMLNSYPPHFIDLGRMKGWVNLAAWYCSPALRLRERGFESTLVPKAGFVPGNLRSGGAHATCHAQLNIRKDKWNHANSSDAHQPDGDTSTVHQSWCWKRGLTLRRFMKKCFGINDSCFFIVSRGIFRRCFWCPYFFTYSSS